MLGFSDIPSKVGEFRLDSAVGTLQNFLVRVSAAKNSPVISVAVYGLAQFIAMAGDWNWVNFNAPSNPTHSMMIL